MTHPNYFRELAGRLRELQGLAGEAIVYELQQLQPRAEHIEVYRSVRNNLEEALAGFPPESPAERALNVPVNRLDLNRRVLRVLEREGIRTLRDAVALNQDQYLNFAGFGKYSLAELNKAVEDLGFTLGQEKKK